MSFLIKLMFAISSVVAFILFVAYIRGKDK